MRREDEEKKSVLLHSEALSRKSKVQRKKKSVAGVNKESKTWEFKKGSMFLLGGLGIGEKTSVRVRVPERNEREGEEAGLLACLFNKKYSTCFFFLGLVGFRLSMLVHSSLPSLSLSFAFYFSVALFMLK